MLAEIWKTDSMLVREAADEVLNMLLHERKSVLKASLSLLNRYITDADISIFDKKQMQIMATTVCNTDDMEKLDFSLHMILSNNKDLKNVKDSVVLDNGNRRYYRPNVRKVIMIPLYTCFMGDKLLCVEYFSRQEGMPLRKLQPVIRNLALAVELCGRSMAEDKGRDIETGLLLRNSLYDGLREICATQKQACLGMICVTTAGEMNEKYGVKYVDKLLAAVGCTIKDMFPRSAYRISGTKFAILLYGCQELSFSSLDSVIDRILALDTELVASGVLTEVVEDVYSTIHICESNLKYAQGDMVTVVRRAASIDFEKEYVEISETYFVDGNKIRNADTENKKEETDRCEKRREQVYEKVSPEAAETLQEEIGNECFQNDTFRTSGNEVEGSGPAYDEAEYYETMTDGLEEEFDGGISYWAYDEEGDG